MIVSSMDYQECFARSFAMDAHKAIITNIFNNSTLIEVPFFQRSYVWKEDLWARMIEDMVLLSDKSCHSGVEPFG